VGQHEQHRLHRRRQRQSRARVPAAERPAHDHRGQRRQRRPRRHRQRGTFAQPSTLLLDGSGHLFVGEDYSGYIRKITLSSGQVQTVAGAAAALTNPSGFAFDGDHTIYFSDKFNHCIRTLDSVAGTIGTTLAGMCGAAGSDTNTTAANARFYAPAGLALDRAHQLLYVADSDNFSIRKIDLAASGQTVTTISGIVGSYTYNDNTTLALATYRAPYGLAFDDTSGILYVADIDNSAVRKLDLANNFVST
jgi:sugar lactone lactonase YvrE